uniref:Secreted protein n=1 Tax=Steinernema glaseri TaxID=37863 RepID=A0A1I7ZHW2_9BILA
MALSSILVLLLMAVTVDGFSFNNYGKYKLPKYNTLSCSCRVMENTTDREMWMAVEEPTVPTSTPTTAKKLPEVVVIHKTEFKPHRDHVVDDENGPYVAGRLAAFGKMLDFLDRLQCTCEGNPMDLLKAERFIRFSVSHA